MRILDARKLKFSNESEFNNILKNYWETKGYLPQKMYVTYNQRALIFNFVTICHRADKGLYQYNETKIVLKK